MAVKDSPNYSVPSESQKLFLEGILNNPLIKNDLPPETAKYADRISFEGNAEPSIHINWRFAESVASLKACEGAVLNVLLQKKYGIEPARIEINTDHAQLFIMSPMVWILDPAGENMSSASIMQESLRKKLAKYFPSWDFKRASATFHRSSATNIYRTRDGRYFHLHGSMDSDPTLKSLGFPMDRDYPSLEAAWPSFMEAVGSRTADEMDHLAAEEYRQAGTICYTTEEYRASEHGQANAHVGLFEIDEHRFPGQDEPSWWPDVDFGPVKSSPARPLAGLKVVDLTRVIAAPAVSRGLAELGASVMRVVAPHLPDMSVLHLDMNHGKWNATLDLREEKDRKRLQELVQGADVFVQGYRPGVFDNYGFGEKDVLKMCKARERGIIYVRENCYGWHGPWVPRSGWQQISDANCGVSYEFGRAMGNDEPVTPVFPNSDFCTGISGVIGVLTALIRRGEKGGSYTVSVALNYYSQWLVNSCGVYPDDVWQALWKQHGSPVFRHYHSMEYSVPRMMKMLHANSAQKLFQPSFFTQYHVKNIGKDLRIPAPVLRFPNGEVKPGFQVGTRTNGLDKPKWPEDLSVEVVV